MSGINAGTIMYKIVIKDPKTLALTYNVNKTLNYNATASDFAGMLTTFASFSSYSPSVTLTLYDFSGQSTTDPALAYTYNYRVSMTLYRPATYSDDVNTQYKLQFDMTNASNTVNTSTTPTVTYAKIQEHSPPVSGNYTLAINSTLTAAINYDDSASTVASKIRDATGYTGVEVDVTGNGYPNGASYIISFVGVKGDLPAIVPDVTNLTGGKVGTSPQIVVSTYRDGSSNLLVEPVTT